MRRIVVLISLVLGVFLLFSLLRISQRDSVGDGIRGYGKKTVRIKGKAFSVEIADTEKKRMQGLSDRKELGEREGMLFVFPTKGIPHFWMKDMRFPLDFLWIRDGSVADVTENVPPPSDGDPLDSLPFYSPREPVDMVLEVNAGTIRNVSIAPGDRVDIE